MKRKESDRKKSLKEKEWAELPECEKRRYNGFRDFCEGKRKVDF